MNDFPNHNRDERLRTQTNTADNDNYEPLPQRHHNMTSNNVNDNMSADKRSSLTTYNHITYFLYVVSYFTAGLLWILPIVMNYAKRHDADGTWLATHFDWQIKTFWYSVVWFVIGIVIITFALGGFGVSILADSSHTAIGSLLLAGFGLLIMTFTFIWHLYRIVRGWIALTDSRPVP
ncbi:DUF4870 family protein [Psychrobacter sp. AOP31-A1-22]|uniref:DUF4870 family protein n=2 Tax=Psychrobacter TaxID=497 RepID=UPI004036C58D